MIFLQKIDVSITNYNHIFVFNNPFFKDIRKEQIVIYYMEQVPWCGHLLLEGWSTAGGKSSCYQHMVETAKCELLCTLHHHPAPHQSTPEHLVDRHRLDAGLGSALMHRLNGHICHRIVIVCRPH